MSLHSNEKKIDCEMELKLSAAEGGSVFLTMVMCFHAYNVCMMMDLDIFFFLLEVHMVL
jgi:hypothetical protein